MKFIQAMAIIALAFVNTHAHAMKAMILEGGRVGNGGGLVVCRDLQDHSIRSVELLDYYEARTQRNFKLELSSLSGEWKDQTQQLIERLNRVTPFREQIYSMWLKSFDSEVIYLKDVQFSTIPDSGYIAVPKGCAFEQGLIQTAPRFAGDKRYFVNDELWQKMSAPQRAGLLLHEFLYREALGYGHEDSISVRYLSGFITSDQFQDITLDQWTSILKQAHFEMTDYPLGVSKLVTKMDLAQIWRPSPDEKTVEATLLGRIPLMLGRCMNAGCTQYNPSNLATPGLEVEVRDYPLHPMTSHIQYQDFSFSIVTQSLPLEHLALVMTVTDGDFINTIRPYQPLSEALPSLLRGQLSNLSSVDATLIHFGKSEQGKAFVDYAYAVNFNSPNLTVGSDDSCKNYTVSFFPNGKVNMVIATPDQSNRSAITGMRCNFPSTGMIRYQDGDRLLEIDAESTRSFISFDEKSGRYTFGGLIAQIQTGNSRFLTCNVDSNYHGCMQSAVAPYDGSHFVNKGRVTFAYQPVVNGQIDSNEDRQFITFDPQTFQLNAVGAPQSLVLSEEASLILSNGTKKHFTKGEIVYFDEQGGVKP